MGRAFSPLDEELELGREQLSPWLVEASVRLGTWVPFEQVPRLLAFFTQVTIDRDTARRLTEAAGRALETVEAADAECWEQGLTDDGPPGPAVAQVSADGAHIPLGKGEWAEVKTVAVGSVTTRTTSAGETVARAAELSYFSRLTDHLTFRRLAGPELQRRGLETAGLVVGVMDGSDWLQGFLDYHCPEAVRILDFPHAVEHLTTAAQASLGAGTAALTEWLARQSHILKHDGPGPVLAALAALPVEAAADPRAAIERRDETVAYLTKRLPQIQYPAFRAARYPIGSGSVESANKLVVEARLKGSGMRWARPNVNPLLALRGAACSDRWEAAYPRLRAEQRVQSTQLRRQRCRRRPAAVPAPPDPVPPPVAAPVPAATAVPASLPSPTPASPPRPKLVVNGRPTADHPWRRSSPFRHSPATS